MQDFVFSRRGFLALAGAGVVGEQTLCGQRPQTDATFSADVRVVGVLATIRDRSGKIVTDLTKNDFTVTENDRARTIRYFSRETELPLALGLLVDASMSQREVLGEEKTASYRFLEKVLREDKDLAFLIQFDREIQLLQDLTGSRSALEKALSRVDLAKQERPQFGQRGDAPAARRAGTALYDAVLLAADEVLNRQTGRKAIILLTDGVDTGSKVSIDEAIVAAIKAEMLVYSILFTGAGGRPRPFVPFGGKGRGGNGRASVPSWIPESDGKKVLQRISRETGGGFFEVSGKLPLDEIYRQIEEELRSQYSLGFSPAPSETNEGFRRIGITVKRPGMVIQSSEGYYPGR